MTIFTGSASSETIDISTAPAPSGSYHTVYAYGGQIPSMVVPTATTSGAAPETTFFTVTVAMMLSPVKTAMTTCSAALGTMPYMARPETIG